MSTDDDFMAYVGTHWSPLVRVALLLDGPERAEALVQDALIRTYLRWDHVWEHDRADVDVLTNLLAGIYAPLGRDWRGEAAAAEPLPGGPGDIDESADVPELVRALRPLAPLHRDVLVLRYVAGLADEQTAEVLAVHPDIVRDRLGWAMASVESAPVRDECR